VTEPARLRARALLARDLHARLIRTGPDRRRYAYRERGWTDTEGGRPEPPGHSWGPCAGCQGQTVRYGAAGSPLCPLCRTGD